MDSNNNDTIQILNGYVICMQLLFQDAELEEDGALRNPYAAWEWGATLRSIGDMQKAVETHQLAAEAFDEIGDKVRSTLVDGL